MPIVDDQRRLAEKGRIRLGQKKTSANGKEYPAKLTTFRLTSPDRRAIEAAAVLYGGQARPWEGQWEVVTDASDLAVAVMPAIMEFDSWYEDWTGAVCRKRCNGSWDEVRNVACDCDPDQRVCKSTTRIQLILPDLPLGTWRLETHGYYARVELNGAVDIIRLAAGVGTMLPARLRLEQRSRRVLVGDKVEQRNFVVPILDLEVSARQLMAIDGGGLAPSAVGAGGEAPPAAEPVDRGVVPSAAMSPPPAPPSWQPVDQAALPAAPLVSVEDQMAEVHRDPKPRKNAAAPIKPTGVKPRAAADTICHLCGQPYSDGPLVKNRTDSGNKFIHRACVQGPADGTVDVASRDVDGDGRGGTQRETPSTPDPAPAVAPAPVTDISPRIADATLSHTQLRKIMALLAEAFPVDPQKVTGPDADAMRREITIALAGQLGHPIQSRSDLTKAGASVVIDALIGIKDGTYQWADDRLITANGEIVAPT